MSKCTCGCATASGPAIRELRRDAFKEANNLIKSSGVEADFDQTMTLACFLIGLGEDEDQ